MYFKSDIHELIFMGIVERLNIGNNNKQHNVFAYMAAATEKPQIIEAFSQHDIYFEALLKMSQKWSAAEKYFIELGRQFYDGSNFYSIENEQEKK